MLDGIWIATRARVQGSNLDHIRSGAAFGVYLMFTKRVMGRILGIGVGWVVSKGGVDGGVELWYFGRLEEREEEWNRKDIKS